MAIRLVTTDARPEEAAQVMAEATIVATLQGQRENELTRTHQWEKSRRCKQRKELGQRIEEGVIVEDYIDRNAVP